MYTCQDSLDILMLFIISLLFAWIADSNPTIKLFNLVNINVSSDVVFSH